VTRVKYHVAICISQ